MVTGAVVGLGLGAFMWHQTKPNFTSEGLVRIAYSLPQVRGETDQNQALPMFETFMQSQKTLITSHRVIDAAVKSPVWGKFDRTPPADAGAYYGKHLTVETRSLSEFIRIMVNDADGDTAKAAVTAVVQAYADQYYAQEKSLDQQRIGFLEERQKALTEQLEKTQGKINAKAQEFGTTELGPFYTALSLQRARLEAALTDVRLAIAGASPTNTQPSAVLTMAGTDQGAGMTPEQIASVDPVMRAYVDNEIRLQAELDRLLINLGPAHRAVMMARSELERAKSREQAYAEIYRQSHSFGPATAGGSTSPLPLKSLTALQTTESNLMRLGDKAKDEMTTIGNAKLALEQMMAEKEAIRTELAGLGQRIELLRGEGALGGRLSVISMGETPLLPNSSKRMQLVSAAAMGGTLLPVGAVLLVSLIRRRYRYSEDAAQDTMAAGIPTLGVLPDVSGEKDGSAMMMAGGYAVHHLRVLLASASARWGKKTYLVTSSSEGEGRTSVAMGLAVSFAAAKFRTLVIDCDFVTGRMTEALKAQNRDGLYEAMEDPAAREGLLEITPHLSVLPTGRTTAADACSIPRGSVRSLLETTFKDFDIILVDTGPVLESLEAVVLAQEVDGVVLTIGRNQRAELVAHAVRRLESLGAPIVGTIFNRARMDDFQCAGDALRPASANTTAVSTSEPTALQQQVAVFGPLVRAVAATVPASWK